MINSKVKRHKFEIQLVIQLRRFEPYNQIKAIAHEHHLVFLQEHIRVM